MFIMSPWIFKFLLYSVTVHFGNVKKRVFNRSNYLFQNTGLRKRLFVVYDTTGHFHDNLYIKYKITGLYIICIISVLIFPH